MLETIWFVSWGVLWAVYFALDGFDLGVGILMPFAARNDPDKKALLHTIGPFWNGNEVWLVAAGGVTFAAFPASYAALFSAFYTPLMVILFALILRGICIEFRGHAENPAQRRLLDIGIFLGSLLPALLFGVAFANIFRGIPLDGSAVFHGSTLTLLNTYGLCGGVLFVLAFLVHGSLWASWRTRGELAKRIAGYGRVLWIPLVVTAVAFLFLSAIFTSLWHNYRAMPVLVVIPVISVCALLYLGHTLFRARMGQALISSFVFIGTCVLFGVIGLYPNILPSTLDPAYSLNVGNSASGPLTLTIMLVVVLVALPCIVLYQGWVYRLFLGKGGQISSETE
jgi:cytochrome bd ubiquinol oxidase subunit II